MSKSRGGGLFGSLRPGEVSIVEAPVSRSFARRARVTFYAVSIAVTLVTLVALHHRSPVIAVGVGFGAGLVAGLLARIGVATWPVVRVLWHWAAEITVGLLLLAAWLGLSDVTSDLWALVILVALLGSLAGLPAVRHRVGAWAWCAIVRHRLRGCFHDIVRVPGRLAPGRLPLILAARPTPAGERVWLWLRPGLELKDLEDRLGKLAVACWADQVMVARASTTRAALLRIDITRRDPLRAGVASPLVDLLPAGWLDRTRPAAPPLPSGLDLPEIPEPTTAVPPARSRPSVSRSRRESAPADVNEAFI